MTHNIKINERARPTKKPHFISKHECELDDQEGNILPRLAPYAPGYKKFFSGLRKWIIVSRWNYISKMYFRSESAIFREKRRQVRNRKYRFIIHPFSRLCMLREMVVCVMYMIAFIIDPFFASFLSMFVPNSRRYQVGEILQLGLNFLFAFDIFLNFFIGYTIDRTKEIILDHPLIIKHYLQTYFIFDFVGMSYGMVNYFCRWFSFSKYIAVTQLYAFRFVRLKSMLDYMSRNLQFFHVRESIIKCIMICFFTLYIIHWWTCILFLIPIVNKYLGYGTGNSWAVRAALSRDRTVLNLYVECLLGTVCHFFGAGKGSINTKNAEEQLILSFMVMCGVTCHIYVIAVILQLFGTINVSESKYEELIYQLNEYMVTKKLPPLLRKRLFMYYEYRFQKQFFLEELILSSLSEHLRYEVLLYSCRNLIDKVRIFQGASKSVIGTIISMLKHEIFLPNDVIVKPDSISEQVYFISFGTVAIFLPNGREVLHMEDGHHFGDAHMLLPDIGDKTIATVVAIEITEVFYLDKKDFIYCISQHPEIHERLVKVATARVQVYRDRMDSPTENFDTMDIISELRRGRVLEPGRRRR